MSTQSRVGYAVRVIEPDSADHMRAKAARLLVLGMRPVSRGVRASRREALRARRPGFTWGLVADSGVLAAFRVRDFGSADSALRDAAEHLQTADELRPVLVQADDGRMAWWLTHSGEVVIVAARPVSPSLAERRAIAAIRALGRLGRSHGP